MTTTRRPGTSRLPGKHKAAKATTGKDWGIGDTVFMIAETDQLDRRHRFQAGPGLRRGRRTPERRLRRDLRGRLDHQRRPRPPSSTTRCTRTIRARRSPPTPSTGRFPGAGDLVDPHRLLALRDLDHDLLELLRRTGHGLHARQGKRASVQDLLLPDDHRLHAPIITSDKELDNFTALGTRRHALGQHPRSCWSSAASR